MIRLRMPCDSSSNNICWKCTCDVSWVNAERLCLFKSNHISTYVAEPYLYFYMRSNGQVYVYIQYIQLCKYIHIYIYVYKPPPSSPISRLPSKAARTPPRWPLSGIHCPAKHPLPSHFAQATLNKTYYPDRLQAAVHPLCHIC